MVGSVSLTDSSGARGNRPLKKGKVGAADSGLNREIFGETYSFVWLQRIAQQGFLGAEVTWPAPSTPVPTAGVAVGNRETLGRGEEWQRTEATGGRNIKKEMYFRLKKATRPF